MKRILIISDGTPGHLNQSIAFCKIKNISYDILEVKFKLKIFKLFSYILDKFDRYSDELFKNYRKYNYDFYDAVVSTGSSTYYFNKFISKTHNLKSIALMLPKSYKYTDFNYIIAQKHDNPPQLDNIITIPLNLSYTVPKNIIKSDEKSIGIIIGGDNSIFTMDVENIKNVLNLIFKNYDDYLKYVTTSRRTSRQIEDLLNEYEFDYKLIYSDTPTINPIPDFINLCSELFITIDSTSMLSEARANSDADISIIELRSKKFDTKFHNLAHTVNSTKEKVNFSKLLEKIEI
ncbi:mitochondrial fission ELM1 family protein [Poseidonibacter lekithochrous]|uniref:ELM1/GtrOC1 family putative glycosyltransferase n=1 Tax=Poseidonibacter TaxID=2321187 RepID=UPI001C0816D9|nr:MULTISPECIES: ELM1/GtrOC1 family putative glycosyltransferase [Poseidonibacter]MBU3015968.1 mitochondrial fission ELM1 family protein [Poseidonibacter lekithochrous]MDO6829267.1 ELM1/GtrOC1 family putative glycosyltransferase [Poseidonibacter sp. 1_MG-2023]